MSWQGAIHPFTSPLAPRQDGKIKFALNIEKRPYRVKRKSIHHITLDMRFGLSQKALSQTALIEIEGLYLLQIILFYAQNIHSGVLDSVSHPL